MRRSTGKRIYFTLLTAATISGFIVICTMGQSVHRHKVAQRIHASAQETTQPLRTVKEYDGRIGVFMSGSRTPYRIIEYDISLLSEYDRSMLETGITIETEYELQRLIEDIAT